MQSFGKIRWQTGHFQAIYIHPMAANIKYAQKKAPPVENRRGTEQQNQQAFTAAGRLRSNARMPIPDSKIMYAAAVKPAM